MERGDVSRCAGQMLLLGQVGTPPPKKTGGKGTRPRPWEVVNLVDIVVAKNLFYYTDSLAELDDAIHLKPDYRDPHEPVIALDADYVSKASIREICGTITHELIHYYLEKEHDYIVSWKYDNIARDFEDWDDRHEKDWRKELLKGPRPTCPTCVWSRPLSQEESYRGRGVYKTVSCGKNHRPALDTFARACEDYRPREGFDPYIPDPPQAMRSGTPGRAEGVPRQTRKRAARRSSTWRGEPSGPLGRSSRRAPGPPPTPDVRLRRLRGSGSRKSGTAVDQKSELEG